MKLSGRLRYLRLARLIWKLPTYARVVWGLMRDPRTPLPLKALLGAGLAYVVVPIDLVPDAIPILGQADDLTVLLLVLDLFIANAPEQVREEQVARANNGTAQLDQDLARLRELLGDRLTRSATGCQSCSSDTATCVTLARSRPCCATGARAACAARQGQRPRPVAAARDASLN